jgi:DNA-binding response OmpR family regulator
MNDRCELVQLPANAEERDRLADRLEVRTPAGPPTPRVDRNGILRFRGRHVPLSPIEERLARALVDTPGAVVGRSHLLSEAWPGKVPSGASLRTRMTRLRRRIEPLGLTVRSVRGHGYVVEPSTGQT